MFKPLVIIYPLFMVVAGLWIYTDANYRVGNGCFWGAIAFAVPPIGIPLYYGSLIFMAIRDSRGPAAETRREREEQERQRREFISRGEIERLKYMEEAEKHGRTMYNPLTGRSRPEGTYKHFTDQTAEELIQSGRYREARSYLIDMLDIAGENGDVRAQDTYWHYLENIKDYG